MSAPLLEGDPVVDALRERGIIEPTAAQYAAEMDRQAKAAEPEPTGPSKEDELKASRLAGEIMAVNAVSYAEAVRLYDLAEKRVKAAAAARRSSR
jgi:hypothetical protein